MKESLSWREEGGLSLLERQPAFPELGGTAQSAGAGWGPRSKERLCLYFGRRGVGKGLELTF